MFHEVPLKGRVCVADGLIHAAVLDNEYLRIAGGQIQLLAGCRHRLVKTVGNSVKNEKGKSGGVRLKVEIRAQFLTFLPWRPLQSSDAPAWSSVPGWGSCP